MGVRGLQSYFQQHCPSAYKDVNITDLLKRRNTSEEPPIIIVDGVSSIDILYHGMPWIGGCQTKELVKRAKYFVDAFEKIGVRLVFFFDGLTEKKKREVWVQRRLKKLDAVYDILDLISQGKKSSRIKPSKYFIKPAGLSHFLRDVLKILCGCEVHQSLEECDTEMAQYARSNGAFAILAKDTDFVILDKGEALYLSLEDLNIKTMTTRHYDSVALAKSLGIQVSQLPLLATFMGNDALQFKTLRNFHRRITPLGKKGLATLIPNIGSYIRTLPTNESLLLNKVSIISQTVLGSSSRANEILTSIRCYTSTPQKDYDKEDRDNSRNDQWTELVIEARHRHVENAFPEVIYNIMNFMTYESGNVIEDTRKNDLPAFATVTLPIRKRLYGILLQEKDLESGKEHQIEEWCTAGFNSLNGPDLVAPEFPSKEHPGLMALWGKDKKYSDIRWQLFVHSVSSKLDVKQLRTLPAHMVFPTMILCFISDYLNQWEVDAALATAAIIEHYSIAKLKKLPSDPLLSRGIRLSHLFVKIVFVLDALLAASGYPLSKKETLQLNFFDGKLFQSKYRAAKDGASHTELCENIADVQKNFRDARNVVYGIFK